MEMPVHQLGLDAAFQGREFQISFIASVIVISDS